MSQGIGSHCPTTHLPTYPCFLPFPKGWSLPFSSPLVRLSSLLYPYKPRRVYQRLFLIQVCLQAYPFKHSYHFCQHCLHPYRISPFYSSTMCIEADVGFPRQPPKLCWASWVSKIYLRFALNTSSTWIVNSVRDTGSPYVTLLPLCPSQYCCSNHCSQGLRPYLHSISMHLSRSSES